MIRSYSRYWFDFIVSIHFDGTFLSSNNDYTWVNPGSANLLNTQIIMMKNIAAKSVRKFKKNEISELDMYVVPICRNRSLSSLHRDFMFIHHSFCNWNSFFFKLFQRRLLIQIPIFFLVRTFCYSLSGTWGHQFLFRSDSYQSDFENKIGCARLASLDIKIYYNMYSQHV